MKKSNWMGGPEAGFSEAGKRRRSGGFTMVELLVVVVMLAVLGGLSVAGVLKALDVAASVKESAAAKTLITAYLTAASDNNGNYLAGYDRSSAAVTLPDGSSVAGITAWRYPYRLASYFNYDYKSVLLTSNNAQKIDTSVPYSVSAFPSFGINYLFVGGDVDPSGNVNHPGECLQSAGRGRMSILVFATAAGGPPGDPASAVQGYCLLEPPRYVGSAWTSAKWSAGADANRYGQVDARHGNKAVCAFLDGSVRKLGVEELRDMRYWSYQAAATDNPDYTVQ